MGFHHSVFSAVRQNVFYVVYVVIKEILESNVLENLQNKGIKFDLIMTDNINLIASFFKRELNIEKILYANPNCAYSFLMKNIYYNPIYENIIG